MTRAGVRETAPNRAASARSTCAHEMPRHAYTTSTADATRYSDFGAVKSALEVTHACLGISCAHMGGLIDTTTGKAYVCAELCS